MPKPTDLTEAKQKCICDGIVAGMHLSPAAEACKVPANTAVEWMRRGEGRARERPINATYATFAAAVREAEAQCERALVLYWRQQTPENWQAAEHLLARRFPDRWRERKDLNIGGTGKEIVFRVTYGESFDTPKDRDPNPSAPPAPEAG